MRKLLIAIFIAVLVLGYITKKPSPEENAHSASTSSLTRPGMGTTRAPEFQREYEDAARRYDQQMQGLPPNLILPSGETVEERFQFGRVTGK